MSCAGSVDQYPCAAWAGAWRLPSWIKKMGMVVSVVHGRLPVLEPMFNHPTMGRSSRSMVKEKSSHGDVFAHARRHLDG